MQPAAGSSKVFNPTSPRLAISSAPWPTPGGGEPSLQLHEAELSLQAVVDPYARADFFLTFGNGESGSRRAFSPFRRCLAILDESGKMRERLRQVDGQHNHVLPFIDRPLLSTNLLGGEDALADAGISLARLIPDPRAIPRSDDTGVSRRLRRPSRAPTRG